MYLHTGTLPLSIGQNANRKRLIQLGNQMSKSALGLKEFLKISSQFNLRDYNLIKFTI